MALTLTVLSGKNKASGAAALTFDAPRIVIGRGDGCEMRLPDPSVSARHASIRARGAEYLLIDENSRNGTVLGKVLLTPHSPRVLRSGDRIRIGRIWLEVRVGPAMGTPASPAAARALALSFVAEQLAERGEPHQPLIRVVEGPDAGKTLTLEEPGRLYVIGRAAETHLALDDADVSRRHVGVTLKADRVVLQDLGSKAGALLDGARLATTETLWKPGQALQLGRSVIALIHPAAEALSEIERGPDEGMSPEERAALDDGDPTTPPPESAESEPSATPPPVDDFPETPPPPVGKAIVEKKKKPAGGWGITDAAVVLLALGVLVLSAAGWWLLR
ncbi:MAG: FHA domain-containing protein [Polyangiaceae bacterium]|nr:FHA domain-containing protein [Polyangiaceae bacterium]